MTNTNGQLPFHDFKNDTHFKYNLAHEYVKRLVSDSQVKMKMVVRVKVKV